MRRLLPFLLFACAAPDRGDVKIIGHGGVGQGSGVPLNSEKSVREALESDVDGVEIDVQLTADSVLVAYHGMDLVELTDCTGKVNAHKWSMISQCTVSGHDNTRYPIVRLDSLLLDCASSQEKPDFTLDCKLFAEGDWWGYLHAFSDALLALEEQPSLKGRILVDCQTEDFLRLVKQKRPDLPTYLYVNEIDGAIAKAVSLECAGITISHDRISASEIEEAHEAGLQVALFGTYSSWDHRRALGKHPDRLPTDAPKLILR